MNSRQLWFAEPCKVAIHEQQLQPLKPDEILVKTLYSAISAGTEMLVYRGQIADAMALDESLPAFKDQGTSYPLQYGYACAGRIEQAGKAVDTSWVGKTVFAFQPHASHNISTLREVVPIPDGIDPLAAVFLANMETAVNLVLDGNPRLGEQVVIMGQGIVGLLVSGLLAKFPLAGLYAVEPIERRRLSAKESGVHDTYDPESETEIQALKNRLNLQDHRSGADLIYELTGLPEALNLAIESGGFSGRIVVGSWYGTKCAQLNLGGRFHRNRLNIISSQVSTIAPELTGRWDKARRFSLAWDMIRECRPEQFITHTIPFASAADAYQLLDESPEEALQVIFDYQD